MLKNNIYIYIYICTHTLIYILVYAGNITHVYVCIKSK